MSDYLYMAFPKRTGLSRFMEQLVSILMVSWNKKFPR